MGEPASDRPTQPAPSSPQPLRRPGTRDEDDTRPRIELPDAATSGVRPAARPTPPRIVEIPSKRRDPRSE
jgi:hypothetical protein